MQSSPGQDFKIAIKEGPGITPALFLLKTVYGA
jgi:hypothetical protein